MNQDFRTRQLALLKVVIDQVDWLEFSLPLWFPERDDFNGYYNWTSKTWRETLDLAVRNYTVWIPDQVHFEVFCWEAVRPKLQVSFFSGSDSSVCVC